MEIFSHNLCADNPCLRLWDDVECNSSVSTSSPGRNQLQIRMLLLSRRLFTRGGATDLKTRRWIVMRACMIGWSMYGSEMVSLTYPGTLVPWFAGTLVLCRLPMAPWYACRFFCRSSCLLMRLDATLVYVTMAPACGARAWLILCHPRCMASQIVASNSLGLSLIVPRLTEMYTRTCICDFLW